MSLINLKQPQALLTAFIIFLTSLSVPGQGRAADLLVAETYGIGEQTLVRALAVDNKAGTLWVGTSVGVMEVDLTSRAPKAVLTRVEGLANERILSIAVSDDGTIWFGTSGGGMTAYTPSDGEFRTFVPMHGLADFWVHGLDADGKDTIWAATLNGVSRLAMRTKQIVTFQAELPDTQVYAIDVDKKGRVWLGTRSGAAMFDQKKWDRWSHDEGVGAKIKGQVDADQGGTFSSGIEDITLLPDAYDPDSVFAVHVGKKKGGIWFGTRGAGVSLFDGKKKWRSFTDQDGLVGNTVYAIAEDQSGALLFGTNKGLSRFDGKNWQSLGFADGLISAEVYSIAVDQTGAIWLGGKGGMTRVSVE